MRLPHSLNRRFASYSMFGDMSNADQLYIACGYTDMRKSIDGLIHLVQHQLQLNPFQNHLFLFCGRKRDRMKALYWEGDGFVLLYKRLESGQYQWPHGCESRTLNHAAGVSVVTGGTVDPSAESNQKARLHSFHIGQKRAESP